MSGKLPHSVEKPPVMNNFCGQTCGQVPEKQIKPLIHKEKPSLPRKRTMVEKPGLSPLEKDAHAGIVEKPAVMNILCGQVCGQVPENPIK